MNVRLKRRLPNRVSLVFHRARWLMSAQARRRVITTTIIVLVVTAFTQNPAGAHAYLEESSPAPNAIVESAPSEVTMRFSEPLERSYSQAELYDQDGNLIPEAATGEGDDAYSMVLNLPANLPRGTYSVLWRTLSTADGHTAQNYLTFTIGTSADVDPSISTASLADDAGPPLWLESVAKWTAYIGLAAALGIWPTWLFVLRPAISPAWRRGPMLTRNMRAFAVGAVVFAFLGNLFAILVQASTLTDQSYVDALRTTLGDTRYGRLWLLRIALLLVYGLLLQWAAWWRPRRTMIVTSLALITAISLPIPFSLISHASAQTTGRTASIVNDVIHLLAASLWVGGLMAIVVVLLPTLLGAPPARRRRVLARALPRFSTFALTAWIALALTGFYSAWLHVGNIDALLYTDYGKSLMIKLAILIPILIFAAFNLFFATSRLEHSTSSTSTTQSWVRRLTYTVGIEAALAIVVLAVVGTLTSQAPAREAIAREPAHVTVDFDVDEREAQLTLTPGGAGPNRYLLEISGEPISHDADILLRLELPAQDTGEKEIEMSHSAGTNTYAHQGSELSIAGDWTFTLIVRPPGEAELRSTTSQEIIAAGPGNNGPSPAWHFGTISGVFGMVTILVGIASAIHIRRSPSPGRRAQVRLVAIAAIAIGAAMLYLGRVDPPPDDSAEAQVMAPYAITIPAQAGDVIRSEVVSR